MLLWTLEIKGDLMMTNAKDEDKARTKPSHIRLNELMDAAEQLFLEKGFQATTVSEIVAKADVAKGTYYHYFTSKNDVLEALRTRCMAWFLAYIDKAITECEPNNWPKKLDIWCKYSIDGYIQSKQLHDTLFHEHYHQSDNAHENKVLQQLDHILAGGKAQGDWLYPYPDLTCLIIYHGMHAAVDNLNHQIPEDAVQLAAALYKQFKKLLD